MGSIIKLENIVKKFYVGEPNELEILHGISLDVKDGEFISIVGPSGSGKSTLMNLIGALDRPTSGTYILDGVDVGEANDTELSEIRNSKVGFVFQTYNLIPKTNAMKNIELPMLYGGMERSKRIERAKHLLELVEMTDRAKHLPEELSGGQKQRVAIARAMANNPAIILADEPTGALDSKTGRLVMDLFHKLNLQEKKTIVLITHSKELASETDRIISIRDGVITSVKDNRENKEYNIAQNRKEFEEKKEENQEEQIINELENIKKDSIDELVKSVNEKIETIESVLKEDYPGEITSEQKERIEEKTQNIKNSIDELNQKIEKIKNINEGGSDS